MARFCDEDLIKTDAADFFMSDPKLQDAPRCQDAQDVVQFSAQKDYSKCQMTGFDFQLDGFSCLVSCASQLVCSKI